MKSRILFSSATILVAGVLALAFTSRDACAADSQRPEISFVVHQLKEENVEGPDVERTYFMAAGNRIIFGQPEGCRLSGDGASLLILPTDAGFQGEIHVRQSPFTPESDLAADVLKYRDAASKDMPEGATNVEVQQPVMNPYPYNGWKSLGFTWTYSSYGRSMIRTVSYINLEVGVQVVVTTLAVKSDAKKVDEITRQFMRSWWVMSGVPGK